MALGVELTPEELQRALAMRPKVPLTAEQQAALLEMLEWYTEQKEHLAEAKARRELWRSRFPVIFTAVSAVIGILTLLFNVLIRK